MNAIELISQDLFDKVRSRFTNLEMGDENGNVTSDPRQARFFDFDFTMENVDLGRVSISINERGALKIYYGKGILEGHDRDTQTMWFSFLREMRMFAKRRLLRFDTRDITKSNLNKEDFQFLASTGTKEETMSESRMFGSSKSSYLPLENTKLIVRHSKPVDENQRGSRSRHINALYVENSEGERFKYPFIHLAGAKAMQRHVANGGRPHDVHGQAIIKISEEIAQLSAFKRHVGRHDSMQTEANDIMERACEKLDSLREMMHNLSKQKYYEDWKMTQQGTDHDTDEMILDQATMESYKDKFTVRSFSEDLSQYFPLIHKIMQETSKVDLEDYVGETTEETCNECGMLESSCKCDDDEKPVKEFAQFEHWVDSIVENHLTDDVIEKLKELLDSNLEIGVDGTNAVQSLRGIGIEDTELEDMIDKAGPEGDLKTVVSIWLSNKNDTQAIKDLGLDNPTATKPAEPAAPAEQPPAGAEPGMSPPSPVESKGKDKKKSNPSLKDIAEMVKSFYDKKNKTFPLGETGVVTKVRKELGEWAGELAEKLVRELAKDKVVPEQSLDEAGHSSNFDITLEVNNPKFNIEDEMSQEPETIEVGVNYTIEGEYHPATWGYHGGEPEELPEIEISKIVNIETGEEITDDNVYQEVYDAIAEENEPDMRLTKTQLRKKYREPDDFEENINRMRKLSGLK